MNGLTNNKQNMFRVPDLPASTNTIHVGFPILQMVGFDGQSSTRS